MLNRIIQFFTGYIRYGAIRSPKWDDIRRKHLLIHPKCEVCGTRKGREVHHIKPFVQNPELELDFGNLITLCRPHHLLFGHLMNWSKANILVVNDSMIWKIKITGLSPR